MAQYVYFCPIHQEIEVEHSINDKLQFCPKCEEEGVQTEIKRLISGGTSFQLSGSGWARDNYS